MIFTALVFGSLLGCPDELPVRCSAAQSYSCFPAGTACACTEVAATDGCRGVDGDGRRFVGHCNYATYSCEPACARAKEGCRFDAASSPDAEGETCPATRCLADELAAVAAGHEVCFPAQWDGVALAPECLGLLAQRASDPRAEIAGTVVCPLTGDTVSSYLDCPCPTHLPLRCLTAQGVRCSVGTPGDCPATPCTHPVSGRAGTCDLGTGGCVVVAAAPAPVVCADGVVRERCGELACGGLYPTACAFEGRGACVHGDCMCQPLLARRREEAVCRQFRCAVTGTLVGLPGACPCPSDAPVRCAGRDGVRCLPRGSACEESACGAFGMGVCDYATGGCVCPLGYGGENCTELSQTADGDGRSAAAEEAEAAPRGTAAASAPLQTFGPDTDLVVCVATNALVARATDCPCPTEAPTRCERAGVVDCFSPDVRCECTALLTLDTSPLSCPSRNVTCPDGSSVDHPLDCTCPTGTTKCLNPAGFTCEDVASEQACPVRLPCLDGRGVCDLATGVCACHDGLAGLGCEPRGACAAYSCVENATSLTSFGIVERATECSSAVCPTGTAACTHGGDSVITCLPTGYECGCAAARFLLPVRLALEGNDTAQLDFDCAPYTGVAGFATHPLECECPEVRPKMCITADGPYCVLRHDVCDGVDSLLHNCTTTCDLYQGRCSTCSDRFTCDGRGTCTRQATRWPCECFRDPLRGYWSDASNCTACEDGWHGPDCRRNCVHMFCGERGSCVAGECYCERDWFDRGFAGETCEKCVPGYREGGNCTRAETYLSVYARSFEYLLNGFDYGFAVDVFNEAPMRQNPDEGAMLHVTLPLQEWPHVEWRLPASCAFHGNRTLPSPFMNETRNDTRGVFCALGSLEETWTGVFRVDIPVRYEGVFIARAQLVMPVGLELQHPFVGGDEYPNTDPWGIPGYDAYPLFPETDQPRTAMMSSVPEIPDVLFSFNDSLHAALTDKNFTLAPYLYNAGPGYAVVSLRLYFPDERLAVDTFWQLPADCALNATHVLLCETVLAPGERWTDNEIGLLLDRIAPDRPHGWHLPGGLRVEATVWNHLQHPVDESASYNTTHLVEEPYVAVTRLSPEDLPRIGYTHRIVANMTYPRQSPRSPRLEFVRILVEVAELLPQSLGRATLALHSTLSGACEGGAVSWHCVDRHDSVPHKREAVWNDSEPLGWKGPSRHRWECTWLPAPPQLYPDGVFSVELAFDILASHPAGVLTTTVTTVDPMVTFPQFRNLTSLSIDEYVEAPEAAMYLTPDIMRPGFASAVHVNFTQLSSWASDVWVNITIFNAELDGHYLGTLLRENASCTHDTAEGNHQLSCFVGATVKPNTGWATWFEVFVPFTSQAAVHVHAQASVTNIDSERQATMFDFVSLDPVIPDVGLVFQNITAIHPGMRGTVEMNITVPETAIATDVRVNCTFVGDVRVYKVSAFDDVVVEAYSGMPARKYPYPVVTPTAIPDNVTATQYSLNLTDFTTLDVSAEWESSKLRTTTLTWEAPLTVHYEVLVADHGLHFNATCVVTTAQNPSGYPYELTLPFTPAPDLTLTLSFPQEEAWVLDPVVVQWNLTQHTELDAYFEDVVVDFDIVAMEGGFVEEVRSLTCPWHQCTCTFVPLQCKFPPLDGSWEKDGQLTFLIAPGSRGDFVVQANVSSVPAPWMNRAEWVAHYIIIPLHLPNAAIHLWPVTPHVPGYEVRFQLNVTISGKGMYYGPVVEYDLRNTYGMQIEGPSFSEFTVQNNCTVSDYLVNRTQAKCRYPTIPLPFGFTHTVYTNSPRHNELPILFDAKISSGTTEQSYMNMADDSVGAEMWPHLSTLRIHFYNNTAHMRDTTTYLTMHIQNAAHPLAMAHAVTGALRIPPGKDHHSHVTFAGFNSMAGPVSSSTRKLLAVDAPCERIDGDFALNCTYGSISGQRNVNLTFPVTHGMQADAFCINITIDGDNWGSRSAADKPAEHTIVYCTTVEDVPYEGYHPSLLIGLRPAEFVTRGMQFAYSSNNTYATESWFKTKEVAAGVTYDFAVFLDALPKLTDTSWGRYGYTKVFVNITLSPTIIDNGGTMRDLNKILYLPSECQFAASLDNVECEMWNNEANITLPFQVRMYTGLNAPFVVHAETWGEGVDHLNRTLLAHHFGHINGTSNIFTRAFPDVKPETIVGFDYADGDVLPGRRATVYLNMSNTGESTAEIIVVAELLGNMRFADDFNFSNPVRRDAAVNLSESAWWAAHPPVTWPASRTASDTFTFTESLHTTPTESSTASLTASETGSLSQTGSETVSMTLPTETESLTDSLSATFSESISLRTATSTASSTSSETITLTTNTETLTWTLPTLTHVSETQTFTLPTATATETSVTTTQSLTESSTVTATKTDSETLSETVSLHTTPTVTETVWHHKPPKPWDGYRRWKELVDPELFGLKRQLYDQWPGTFLAQINETIHTPFEFVHPPRSEEVNGNRRMAIAQFTLEKDAHVVLPLLFDVINTYMTPGMTVTAYFENTDMHYALTHNFQTAQKSADLHIRYNATWDLPSPGANNITVIIENLGAGWAGKTTIVFELQTEGVHFAPLVTDWISPYQTCSYNESRIVCEVLAVKSKYDDDVDGVQPGHADPKSVTDHHNLILPWKYELPLTILVDQYFNGTLNFTVEVFTENDYDISNNKLFLNPDVLTPDLWPLIVWPQWPETAYELRIYNSGPTKATDVRTVMALNGGKVVGIYDPRVVNPNYAVAEDPQLQSLPLGLRKGTEHLTQDQDCFTSDTGDFLKCVITDVPYDETLPPVRNYVSRWFRVDVAARAQLTFTGAITNEDRNLANNGITALCPVHSECWTDVKIVQVTGCLDLWPSTVNCPPDGSATITVWGQGFGYEADSRIQVYVGGGRCESLKWHNASAYTSDPAWTDHQLLMCDDYLGYAEGDDVPENRAAYGAREGFGGKLATKEGLVNPVTVVNWRERNKTEEHVTVSFAYYPIILGIDNCGETNATHAGCPTTGVTPLEIRGQHFVGYGGFGAVEVMIGHFPCGRVNVVNDSLIICTQYQGEGTMNPVRVKANGLWDRSPYTTYLHYRPVPVVESVSGCFWSGMSTHHCSQSGNQAITIVGYDLWFDNGGTPDVASVIIGGTPCEAVQASNDYVINGMYELVHPLPANNEPYKKTGTTLRCVGYPWQQSMGAVGQNISLEVVLHGEKNRERTTMSFSELKILKASGCLDFHPSTVNCHSAGLHPITLIGRGFGSADARVWLGDAECGTVTHGLTLNTTGWGPGEAVVCKDYISPTLFPSYYPDNIYPRSQPEVTVVPTISTQYGLNYTEPGITITFSRRPEVLEVEGCRADAANKSHTTGCWTNGTMPLTVRGRHFLGELGFGQPKLWVGEFECKKSIIVSNEEMVCLEYPGVGDLLRVEVRRGIPFSPFSGRFAERSGRAGVEPFYDANLGSTIPRNVEAARWMLDHIEREEILASYRLLPLTRTIAGCGCTDELIALGVPECALESSNHTVLCSTGGETTLTVTGYHFGTSGASVYIGGRTRRESKLCDTVLHDGATPDNIVYCVGYQFAGQNLQVTVVQDDEESRDPTFMSFVSSCPFWSWDLREETVGTSNNGTMCNSRGVCDSSCPGSPAQCICEKTLGGGYWDGVVCQDCLYGYYGVECKLPCPGPLNVPCNNQGLCLGGIYGPGTCDCYDGYAGVACEKACPRDVRDRICGGHLTACSNGTFGLGICTCPSSAEEGFWAGDACESCQPGWSQDCKVQCNGGYLTPCSSRGICAEGPVQNGTCTCFAGYAGTECEIPCDGGPTNPCNQRGTCDKLTGKCTCAQSTDTGFWSGATCSSCLHGYSGESTLPVGCVTACPLNATGAVCSDLGTCKDGTCFCVSRHPVLDVQVCAEACNVTGTACDAFACPSTYWGASCDKECAGRALNAFGVAVACNGNGVCSEGKVGNGACSCESGYGGLACVECPGGAASPCSFHGTCSSIDATCSCYSGYAGTDCGITCAGGAITPCTSHGTCSMGVTGDGTCVCEYGYLGADCSNECPGGATNICSGNGNCTSIGTCVCEDDNYLGHWTGTACESCVTDWFGSRCHLTCPKAPDGTKCSNHGTCPDEVDVCTCDNSFDRGYWQGHICADCQEGYFGTDCHTACPGGACNPCNGHGVCSSGVVGQGWCNCTSNATAGWWDKTDCSDCKQGWYGAECASECPGGWIQPCSGHGSCSEGVFGSGACKCDANPETVGVWGGFVCADCAAGWFSGNCSLECPSIASKVCSGKGVCSDGRGGTGLCGCFPGYAGETCELECPRDTLNRICGGFAGACDGGRLGSALCTCPRNTVDGYWAEPACAVCRDGFGGADCTIECPGGAVNPCSGNGACSEGTGGNALCTCFTGYSGAACELECPGGQGYHCSRRGTCVNGACVCVQAPSPVGYWTGSVCDTCLSGYSGVLCDQACPLSGGLPCAGKGVCYNGECLACSSSCGTACELTGADCVALACPTTYAGATCTIRCDGSSGTTVCSGNGVCSDGKAGTGKCACHSGYAGTACNLECDGGAATPCSGNGVCDAAVTGTCTCNIYFATATCEVACKGFGTTGGVCTGRGTCNDGASGDGSCTCQFGWGGESCEKECPGGHLNPCSNHGACDQLTALCLCVDDTVLGHFGGASCSSCQDGWYGDSCLSTCPPATGTTTGRECACSQGWAAPDCSVECFGGASNPCSRNGNCNDTNAGDGTCACNYGFRGQDCRFRCAGHAATGLECSGHGGCQAGGVCLCHTDAQNGFWASDDCSTCAGDYFGLNCDQLCPKGVNGLACSGNGQCTQTQGACVCRVSATAGYWEGDVCERCQPGYWGPRCREPCPGGACAPCGGNGVCDEGVLGTGVCTCAGNWAGVNCDTCLPGFFGKSCSDQCPGGVTAETWCSGNGDCSQGPTGSGDCVCHKVAGKGWWAGALCDRCLNGYFGATCSTKCPGDNFPCAGNGVCSQGVTGTGLCTCNQGYAGHNCSIGCTVGPTGDFCSGATYAIVGGVAVEACDWGASGTGLCRCPGSTEASGLAFGFLSGDACEKCQPGYAGSDCRTVCPGVGSATGECSGHGTCEDGKSGTGKCLCGYGYAGSDCSVPCTGGSALPCNGRGKCQQGDAGPPLIEAGSCTCFASLATGYFAPPDCLGCATGWSGRACTIGCPTKAGVVCSGHGTCMDGVCHCDESPTLPYCSTACELSGFQSCSAFLCPAGFWGSACDGECVGGAASPCSGNGLCSTGTKGDGTCTCFSGYAGLDCAITCDGGALYPCSGTRGTCLMANGKCECKTGFAGFDCSVDCKGGAGTPCSDHGTCSEGATGDGSCTCDTGFTGSDCSIECRGGAAAPCNNHGTCLPDGSCQCYADWNRGFYQGASCDKCQSQFSGPNCLKPCIHGVSVNNVCQCHPGYANANCTLECAGFKTAGYQEVCAGHGTCNDGNTGDGTCACTPGYVGLFCNLQCPGITQGNPCTGHGVCDVTTSNCICDDNAGGHWAGVDCGHCAEGYFGSACDMTCPSLLPHPILCTGHGECDPLRVTCNCFQNSTNGFWDEFDCRQCSSGFWGTSCENECTGGACKPCSGHGACYDGWCSEGTCETWRGSCNCTQNSVDGYWTGTNCDACTVGYWSSTCTAECPGGVTNVCSGRGVCSQGQYGTGLCTCNYDSALGYWGGPLGDCADCWVGFYGADCRSACLGNVPNQPITCSGQGTCDDGLTGAGGCTCFKGYAGADCGIACPRARLADMDAAAVCTGHGTCSDGTDGDGTCACIANPTAGMWTGIACSECVRGFWGESCTQECLGGAQTACTGHGACREGTSGDGSCICDFGWALEDCSRECDGGSARPCFGRGTCRPADGGCDCVRALPDGFWDGAKCDQCAYGYSGVQCDILCPHNGTDANPGLPCSGVGVCKTGVCYDCATGHCNSLTKKACQITGDQCFVNLCPTPGQWGSNCENECPGGIGAATCSGNGRCDDGRIGNGLCACNEGYMFADCSVECPGGATTPCNNVGVCDTVVGTCTCFVGFAGAACDVECPGGYYNPCNAHGACNDGSTQPGDCVCFDGWAGTDCSIECTGGNANPCSGNGVCSKVDGKCTCFSNTASGFWQDANCDMCQQGYYEANCTAVCHHGTTRKTTDGSVGGVCHCEQYWARLPCDYPCPVSNDTAALPCAGQGYCQDGHTNIGDCVCDNNYYTFNCQVYCHPDVTCTALEHAQCNVDTGTCECLDSLLGHWAGATCSECKVGYWGDDCSKACVCNGHGTCDRGTGVCQCYRNSFDGFWDGVDCGVCVDGYVGFDCTSQDVRITRTKDAATPVRFVMKVTDVGVHLPDRIYGLSYAGGRPLLMWDDKTETLLDNVDLLSAVVSAFITPNFVTVICADDNMYRFWRGKRDFTSARTGGAVASGGSVSVDSIVVGGRRKFSVLEDRPTAATNFTYSKQQTQEILQALPYNDDIHVPLAPVDIHKKQRVARRTFSTLGALGLSLVGTITDSDHDIVYLIWSGPNARQIYYQRSSTLDLVRIVDISSHIDKVNAVAFFKSFGKLCIAGEKNGKWEAVMFQTATLVSTRLSTVAALPGCEGCSASLQVAQLHQYAYISLKIPFGLRMARIDVQTYAVLQYDTLRRQASDNIVVTALMLDELSNSGFVFAHMDADPTVAYKFFLDTLRIYGTNKFFSTGTNVERIISVSESQYVLLLAHTITHTHTHIHARTQGYARIQLSGIHRSLHEGYQA